MFELKKRVVDNPCCRAPLALVLAAAIGLAGGCDRLSGQTEAKGKEKKPAVAVLAAPVVQKSVPVELRTFGTVEPNFMVAVKAQVSGILKTIHFKEGQNLKADAPLFTLDSSPYEAALEQAKANYARDKAQYANALKEVDRQVELLANKVAAQQDYDTAKTAADVLLATLAGDEAMLKTARIQLDYCEIRSPIDARAGAWQVDAGNLVNANGQLLVTLNQIRPIQLSFSLPQKELDRVKAQAAKAKLQVRAFPPGQEDTPEVGELVFIDNNVDLPTRTFQLKAKFDNPSERLWPGLFVNVVLVLELEPDAIIIPTHAIQTGQKGQFVYVIGPDSKVHDQLVTVERAINDDTIIADGLKAGETVVTDGQLRLKPGDEVVVKQSISGDVAPKAKAESTAGAAESSKAAGKGGAATKSGGKAQETSTPSGTAAEALKPDVENSEALKL
jgi:multidrug efflux system membrane fusion protein